MAIYCISGAQKFAYGIRRLCVSAVEGFEPKRRFRHGATHPTRVSQDQLAY